eukprot:Gb_15989 [translate_table: standard]
MPLHPTALMVPFSLGMLCPCSRDVRTMSDVSARRGRLIMMSTWNTVGGSTNLKGVVLARTVNKGLEVLKAFPGFFYNDGNRVGMAHSSRSIIKSITMEDSEIQQEQDKIYVLLQRIATVCGTSSQLDNGWWVKPRSLVWFDRFLCEVYDDNRWVEILRVSRSTFVWLCDQVQSDIEKHTSNWRLPIPVTCRVGAALYRLASGCALLAAGAKFRLGASYQQGPCASYFLAKRRIHGYGDQKNEIDISTLLEEVVMEDDINNENVHDQIEREGGEES